MRRSPLSFAALAAVAACHAAPGPEVRFAAVGDLPPPAAFPGAADILRGADAVEPASRWCAGDEVLFGLRLRRGDRVRHWLLHLRLTEPVAIARAGDDVPPPDALPPVLWTLRVNDEERSFLSARCRVLATVYDAAGTVLGRTEPLLPRDFLDRGFTRACELVAAQRADGPADGVLRHRPFDVHPYAEATVAAMALLQVVQEDAVLAPLLWEVVEKPSWWSIVRHLGARVVVRPDFQAAEAVASPVAAGEVAWRVPLELSVHDQPVLHSDLFVVGAARPFALCGGVVGAVARHPSDPGRELSMVLLAARLGSPGPAVR